MSAACVPCRIGSFPFDGLGSLDFDLGYPAEVPVQLNFDGQSAAVLDDQAASIKRCGVQPAYGFVGAVSYNADGSNKVFRGDLDTWIITPDPDGVHDYTEIVQLDATYNTYSQDTESVSYGDVLHGSGTWFDSTGYDVAGPTFSLPVDSESSVKIDATSVYTRSGYPTYTVIERHSYSLPRSLADCLNDAWTIYQALNRIHGGSGLQYATYDEDLNIVEAENWWAGLSLPVGYSYHGPRTEDGQLLANDYVMLKGAKLGIQRNMWRVTQRTVNVLGASPTGVIATNRANTYWFQRSPAIDFRKRLFFEPDGANRKQWLLDDGWA
jgi:hypothetical protein